MEQGFGGTFRKGVYVRSATPVFRGTSSTRADSLPFHCETAYLLALLIGIVAGLRTMTAPAAVSWAAHLGGFASITRGSPFWDTPGHLAS